MINFIILLNLFLASISIIFYTNLFSTGFLILSLIVFGSNVIYFRRNVVMFLRIIFLGSPAVLAMVTKLVNQNGFFGFHLLESQTPQIVQIMTIVSNLGSCGAVIGYCAVSRWTIANRKMGPEINIKIKYVLYFLVFILTSWLLVKTRGASILTHAYGSQESSFNTGLGNLNSIAIMCLLCMYFYSMKLNSQSSGDASKNFLLLPHLATFYFIVYVCLMHGARLDALVALVSAFVFLKLSRGETVRIHFRQIIMGMFLLIILQLIGGLRAVLAHVNFSEIVMNISRIFQNLVQEKNSGIIFYQGTINDIATGISGIIFLVKEKNFEFLFGSGYIDYFERIPPTFIHPDRPKDLAWIFYDNGYSSGGGFHELAEAYYNFGLVGAFVIPMAITMVIMSSVKRYQFKNSNLFHHLILVGLFSSLLRGLFYQSFAFFKSVITAYILWLCISTIALFLQGVLIRRAR